MHTLRRRGLSPVIATALLISMALVLAVIVFLWARSFVGEQIEKDGQSIELVCENVRFTAEAVKSEGLIYLENAGSVPIYTVEIRVEGEGEIREVPSPAGQNIGAGQTVSFNLPQSISFGETLILVPVLLGESKEQDDLVPRACDVDYGVHVTVN